jgi:hypothetical protein
MLEMSFLGISNSYIESSEFLSPTPYQLHRLNYSAMPKIVNNFKLVLDHSNMKQLFKTSFMFMHLDAAEKPTIALVHATTITDFITFDQLLRANPGCIPKQKLPSVMIFLPLHSILAIRVLVLLQIYQQNLNPRQFRYLQVIGLKTGDFQHSA